MKPSKESLSANDQTWPKPATIDDVIRRRSQLQTSKNCLTWGLINFAFLLFFAVDIRWSLLSLFIVPDLFKKAFYIFEIILTLIFFVNTVYDFILFAWPYFLMKPIEVTELQKKLLGIRDNEFGFKVCSPKPEEKSSPISKKSSPTPPFEISLSQSASTSPIQSQKSFINTSLNSSSSSLNTSVNLSTFGVFGSSPDSSFNTTSSSSWVYQKPSGSPFDSLFKSEEKSSTIRQRKSFKSNSIINGDSLEKYLKDYEERESRFEEIRQAEKAQEQSFSASPWNMTPSHLKMSLEQPSGYQVFVNSSSSVQDEIEKQLLLTSSPSSRALDSLLVKLKINESQLNQWIENIRKWISQTILSRLISEIDNVNKILTKLGSMESVIGEASLSSIKQTAELKKSQIPTFEAIIPYLQVTIYQQYLVRRLRDLANGGCMREFNWNGGGDYNRKNWNEDLPTDSAIIMHAFCTYMDSRLPPNPNCPEGKTFTNQHFRTVSGPVPKASLYISQVKVNPPHYKVVCEDDVWELPMGRHNLFHTLLVFLFCVKFKYYGLLGRINLGLSGVNILWVIDDK